MERKVGDLESKEEVLDNQGNNESESRRNGPADFRESPDHLLPTHYPPPPGYSHLYYSLFAGLDLLADVHDSVVSREPLDVVRRHVAQQRRLTHAVSPDETVLRDGIRVVTWS